jgi:mediator of RNA polymerase II transcription subunit 6
MSTSTYPDQSTLIHYNPAWIQGQGFLHRNNVLFYFMDSPFFDPASRNSEVFNATQDQAHWQQAISTVDSFHREMALRPGLEFVLAHDPEKEGTMIQPSPDQGVPEGQLVRSNLFVIRKQQRLGDLRTTVPISVYWVMQNKIFQAPSVSNVLNARLLAMGAGLTKVLEKMSVLDKVAPTVDGKKAKAVMGRDLSMSRNATPVPGLDEATMALEKPVETNTATKEEDDDEEEESYNTLERALRMTLNYENEYADQMELIGEPGNLRFSKVKEKQLPAAIGSQRVASSRAGTPAQPRAVSAGAGAR